ncbi:MAG: DUF2953 domain-containing protein [Clostridia bacterium]|nr:DUF2953 domain-containing protein [Clostridia bacterium]
MVFLFILITILLIGFIVFYSKIQIEIDNFKFCSISKRHLNKDYEIIVKLYVLGLFPILKIPITKTKLEKMKVKEKIKNIDFKAIEENPRLNKKIIETIKSIEFSIPKINLYIEIGTENASLTSIIVPTISAIIAIILRQKVKKVKNQKFIVQPIFQNQNLVNLSFEGIFEIKTSHIINIIYRFNKKEKEGVKEYERTSNRGAYDYSYE